ncbi:unnamed protein product [Paramecium sonneborni]|uniref:MORN repeat protein n=1 Tax=Paramecium sonneborni TaxID=65129 RepID=A0A8S1QZI0_9CILI|nr:unnamed protein product [Paramecium sonneborni]
MQLVRLTTKAQTPRNVPLRSPEKTNNINIQFPNYIFLGPIDNIKIVKFTKSISSSSIKEIRLKSPCKDQNNNLVNKTDGIKSKHLKTTSVQIITQSPDLFVKQQSQNINTNSNITALQTFSTKHKYHGSELTQDTCSEQPSIPTLTFPILKYVEFSSNLFQGQGINKSNKLKAQILFQNGMFYEGEIIKLQDILSLDGLGTLYSDNSKFYTVYQGRWKNNSFHGKGRYFNQYQIESSSDWHFNWKMIQTIFSKGEIIEGKIDFYLTEDVIAHQIEYSK